MSKRKQANVSFEASQQRLTNTENVPNAFSEKRSRICSSASMASKEQGDRFSTNFNEISMLNDLSQNEQGQIEAPIPAGVIEEITVKNFKCHSFLKFELNPYINFILGRNGSGKSAVMDAITLCLGGRAATTGRQASAKTFIKTNSDRADLSITIRNIGEEAFKPKEYGKRITIERRINKDGSSSYRLLDEKRKLVTTKKAEVDEIREAFNIQNDNPVCFLNQETSKHFLNSSDRGQKYQYFMKASQIESIKKIQETIDETRRNALKMIEDKNRAMPKMEEDLYNLEVKYKKCQSVDKLRAKVAMLSQELVWAVVVNVEKAVQLLTEEHQILLSKKEKLNDKLMEVVKKHDETNTEYGSIKKAIAVQAKDNKDLNADFNVASEEFKTAQRNYKSIIMEIKRQSTIREKKESEHAQLSERLSKEKKETSENYEVEKTEKHEKITSIKNEVGKIVEQERFKMKDNIMYTNAIQHAQNLLSK